MTHLATRIVIVSSNTFVRLGLRHTFETHPDVMVVGESLWGASARELVEQEQPDLIVVDLNRDMNHLDISVLRQSAPHARIVLLTSWADMERGRQAMEGGADVVMMKCQPASILLAIIESVSNNRPTPHHAIPGAVFKPERADSPPPVRAVHVQSPKIESLTDRERAVVALVGQGLSNRDIAERLFISDTTVRHHLTNIFDKLGVSNRQKLLLLAHQSGLTKLNAAV